MALLAILLPERVRTSASAEPAGDVPPVRPGQEYAWVSSPDGEVVRTQGESPARLLPKATTVVAVLADTDVAWHRVRLPKAPASRLREALAGVLEENLLDTGGSVHLALFPQAQAGQLTWVAAVHRDWLRAQIAAIERSGTIVDRVVPSSWPDHPPIGHFETTVVAAAGNDDASGGDITLTWSYPEGVVRLPLRSGLTRAVLPEDALPIARWTASPAAVAAAQAWTGVPVTMLSPAERALQAARSPLNLRQFDLTPRKRGIRWLRDAVRLVTSPAWRPMRIGAAVLVAVQLLGLNLWAWQQREAIAVKRAALVSTLQTAFPQVRAVLDAPLQMQREVDLLRANAGRPGEADLEPMLQAAAAAWPIDRPPVDSLRYEPGRLTLSAAGWTQPQIDQFRDQLQPAGWQVESADGRLTLSRRASGGAS
jgi:general secretion pathway protein L